MTIVHQQNNRRVTGISEVSSGFNVAGTISTGETLTLTGDTFGNKTIAAPQLFDNFQTGSLTSSIIGRDSFVGSAGAYDQTLGNPAHQPTITDSFYYSGDRCAGLVYPTGGDAFPRVRNEIASTKEAYAGFWSYYTLSTSATVAIWKWLRFGVMPNPYASDPHTWETVWLDGDGTMNWAPNGLVSTLIDSQQDASLTYGPNADAWHYIEYACNFGDVGSSNARYRKWVDGHLVLDWDNVALVGSGDATEIDVILSPYDGLDQPSNVAVGHYIDDYYLDTTLKRVVVGNASTWSSCTKRDPQPATTWTNSQVEVTANLPQYVTSDSIYFYVIDTDGDPLDTNGLEKIVE